MDEILDELKRIASIARQTEHPTDDNTESFLVGWYRQGQTSLIEDIERIIKTYESKG